MTTTNEIYIHSLFHILSAEYERTDTIHKDSEKQEAVRMRFFEISSWWEIAWQAQATPALEVRSEKTLKRLAIPQPLMLDC